MIRLYKTLPPPRNPTKTVRSKLRVIKMLATKYRADYEAGARNFGTEFKACVNHYKHKDIVEQLESDQHKKCCYCEGNPLAHGYMEVEHFRPKAEVKDGSTTLRPGYYWLVCDWENLYWSCKKCNGANKGTQFPLMPNSPARARKHGDPIKDELPVLVDPYKDDPSDFFEWREEAVRGCDREARGNESIRIYGLARSDLVERRINTLEQLKSFIKLYKYAVRDDDTDEMEENLTAIKRMVSPAGLFSAMCRAYLRRYIQGNSQYIHVILLEEHVGPL